MCLCTIIANIRLWLVRVTAWCLIFPSFFFVFVYRDRLTGQTSHRMRGTQVGHCVSCVLACVCVPLYITRPRRPPSSPHVHTILNPNSLFDAPAPPVQHGHVPTSKPDHALPVYTCPLPFSRHGSPS